VWILADESRQEWPGVHCRSSTDAEPWAIALALMAVLRYAAVRIVTDSAAAIRSVTLSEGECNGYTPI
jgi:hypothetical protein